MTPDALFGELRSLLHHNPGPEAWQQLTQLIDQLDDPHHPQLEQILLPYIQRKIAAWPDSLKVAPQPWTTPLALRNPHPALILATRWSCHGRALGAQGFEILAKSSALQNVKELDLRDARPGDRGLKALSLCPFLQNLQRLELGGSTVPITQLNALLQPQVTPQLQSLAMVDNMLSPDDLTLVAQEIPPPHLASLDLSNNIYISFEDLDRLRYSPLGAQLTSLTFNQVQLPDYIIQLLLQLPKLQHLSLLNCILQTNHIQTLLDLPTLHLRSLSIGALHSDAHVFVQRHQHDLPPSLYSALRESYNSYNHQVYGIQWLGDTRDMVYPEDLEEDPYDDDWE